MSAGLAVHKTTKQLNKMANKHKIIYPRHSLREIVYKRCYKSRRRGSILQGFYELLQCFISSIGSFIHCSKQLDSLHIHNTDHVCISHLNKLWSIWRKVIKHFPMQFTSNNHMQLSMNLYIIRIYYWKQLKRKKCLWKLNWKVHFLPSDLQQWHFC